MKFSELREESLLISVLGPTASGKSSLALKLAVMVGGEIVNCDSMQMVQELRIGTAKPEPEELESVPHHLYDFLSLPETYSAGKYMRDSRRICREIRDRGAVPIVVGGTGLYLRALLRGMFDAPPNSSETRDRLKRIARKKGASFLHKWLVRTDPQAAFRIAPNDQVRLVRALEVQIATGRPFSSQMGQEEPLTGFNVLKFGLAPARDLLYQRINQRVEKMFDSGLLDETRRLLKAGYDESCKGFEALGYRYAIQVLKGSMDERKAIELTQRDSRRYAKRQMTWFRREKDVCWIDLSGDSPEAFAQVYGIVRKHLPGSS